MGERLKPAVLKAGFLLALSFDINHSASSEVIIFGRRKAIRRPSVQLNVQPDFHPGTTSVFGLRLYIVDAAEWLFP
jgi:hypothetical protein